MPGKRHSEEQILYALRQVELREENRKLKGIVADLTLDKHRGLNAAVQKDRRSSELPGADGEVRAKLV